jgi:integrase
MWQQPLEGRPYYNFINSIHTEKTRQNYSEALYRFLRMYQITIDELLTLPTAVKEQHIIDCLILQKQKGLSRSTRAMTLSAIKKFYEMNEVIINWKKISAYLGENQTANEDRAYTHEEIRRLLDCCDLRMRMIVLLLASTGMRLGGLNLLVKDIAQTENGYPGRITVYARTPDKYITYCTPECSAAVSAYLDFRRRSGEKITPDSYLIRKQFDANDIEQVRKRSEPVTLATICKLLNSHLVKAGLRTVDHTNKNNRKEVARANGFRKFYTSQLVEADLKTELRWLLEGHALKCNDPHYVRVTEKRLQEEYFKALDLLTINPENRLRRKVEKLEVEKNQFEQLRAQIEALEQKIDNF